MGRRKPRQSNKEIETVSEIFDDPETFDNSDDDDPLALLTTTVKSTKEKKIANKKPAKRKNQGKKKLTGKKAKTNGVADVPSADEDENINEEIDNENTSEKAEEDAVSDYEVEKIIDVQYMKSGAREFLIRWKGFGPEGDTWEPEDNLSCPDIITQFLDKKTSPKKAATKGNKKRKKEIKKKQPVEQEEDSTAEYEVEKIIEVHHRRDGGKEFLIRWKGCSSDQDSWEPEENLSCPELIEKFLEKVEKLSHFEKREVRTNPKHTDRFTLTMKFTGRRTSRRNGDKQRMTYFDAE